MYILLLPSSFIYAFKAYNKSFHFLTFFAKILSEQNKQS